MVCCQNRSLRLSQSDVGADSIEFDGRRECAFGTIVWLKMIAENDRKAQVESGLVYINTKGRIS